MAETPKKNLNTSNTSPLTPVRFLESPRNNSAIDENFQACKTRLTEIIKLLQANFDKWQLAQKCGVSLCTSIEAIKTCALVTPEKISTTLQATTGSTDSTTLYPKELRPYCDKLANLVIIFESIVKSTRDAVRQLRALSQLPSATNAVFYRTWHMKEYNSLLEQISNSYEQELKVKQYISRELAHCTNRPDLVRNTTAWEYPQYVNEWLALMFTFLAVEVKLIKK